MLSSVGRGVRGFGRDVQGLGRDVRGAADGWFSWSQRNKYATILILVSVMILVTFLFHLTPSSGYANANIKYGQDGFDVNDNRPEFIEPQAAAGTSSMSGSKGSQGGIKW
jgi:hypothetical protein